MNNLNLYIKLNKELSHRKAEFVFKSIIGNSFQLNWGDDEIFGSLVLEHPTTQFVNLKLNYDALCSDLMDDVTIVIVPRFEDTLEKIVREKCQPGLYPIVKILPQLLNEDEELFEKLSEFKNKVNEDILETVKVYLELNMSVNMVARLVYTHRNTVNYRITRFIEMTGIDIRSSLNGYYVYMLISWKNPVYNKIKEEENL